MTGRELANLIRKTKGDIYIPMLVPNDIIHIVARKNDLVDMLIDMYGDNQCGMKMMQVGGETRIDVDY